MKIHVVNKYFALLDQDTQVILECKIVPKNFVISGPEITKLLKSLDIDPESLTFRVKATAYLKPTDIFNAETGRRVAESKAMRKVFYKLVVLNLELQEVISDEIVDDTNRYMNALSSETDHFNKLSYGQTASS